MRKLLLLSFILGCLAPAALCQSSGEPLPAVDGYVTSAISPTEFEVDGRPVTITPKTEFRMLQENPVTKENLISAVPWIRKPYIGQHLKIYGKRKKDIRASRVVTVVTVSPAVEGFGIITRVLAKPVVGTGPGAVLVRADGYPVLIDAKTANNFEAPLKSLADIGPNVWIAFHGTQRPDGVVVAREADFVKNEISHGEGKLRKKWDYDPSQVDPKDKQGAWSKAFVGIKLKKIPPYHDPQLQARIDRIGASVIPAYQRNLPDSDPTKIHFQFQLVDSKFCRCAIATPSGVILVPHQAAGRLKDDSQLAAMLASGVAAVLEKEWYRVAPTIKKMEAAQITGEVAGAWIPGANFVALSGNLMEMPRLNQRYSKWTVRVTLGLLADAGYDVDQAPVAYWLLAPRKPKKLADIEIPGRARYAYSLIGTTFAPEAMLKPD